MKLKNSLEGLYPEGTNITALVCGTADIDEVGFKKNQKNTFVNLNTKQ